MPTSDVPVCWSCGSVEVVEEFEEFGGAWFLRCRRCGDDRLRNSMPRPWVRGEVDRALDAVRLQCSRHYKWGTDLDADTTWQDQIRQCLVAMDDHGETDEAVAQLGAAVIAWLVERRSGEVCDAE